MSQDQQRMHTERHRAESFGSIAQEYDEVRPSYPPALLDDLVALRPGRVLDVGCGTGRAAVQLVARGVSVLGVEIDPEMAQVARSHGIDVEVSPFESWDARGRQFDLLVSGQAWHWIDPVIGAAKAATLLRPGGTLALFWNAAALDASTQAYLDAVYREYAPELVTANTGRRDEPPYRNDISASGQFASVQAREYSWQVSYSTQLWLRLVQTHSDHVVLEPQRRERLVAAVGEAIDAHGGQIVAPYTTYAVFATAPSPGSRADMAG